MPTAYAFELKENLRLHFRGETWRVVGSPGTHVTLRNALGREETHPTLDVLGADDFFPILGEREVRRWDPRSVILDTYPAGIVRTALDLEAHLHEYRTGYRSGTPDHAEPGEPREAYDPALTTLTQRLECKARELIAARPARDRIRSRRADGDDQAVRNEMDRLRRLHRQYTTQGLIALVDKREMRRGDGQGRHHPETVKAARRVVQGQTTASNRTILNLALWVRQDVGNLRHATVKPPSLDQARRVVKTVGKYKRLDGKARTRRGLANRPPRVYRGVIATRPGEYVLIDVSPGDFLAIDPISLKAKRYKLVAAIDLHNRSVLSARLLPNDPKGIDLSFTLYDILTPKKMMPGWPETAAYPYVGVPKHIILRLYDLPEDTPLAGIPCVVPQNVVVDNGLIFRSTHFKNLCRLLGITLLYARPFTPTDKPQVERWFRTMETEFAQQLGSYLGSDVSERGENLEEEAVYLSTEIESRLGEWIATVYQRRPHSSLKHHSMPGVHFSPNDLFDLGMSKAGVIVVPLGKDVYYQLLETVFRTIQDYGVEVDGLLYDHPALLELRHAPSEYGHLNHRWPFKRDPRDRRFLWFLHPRTGEWLRLTRRGSAYPDAPFTAEMVRRAKLIALKRGGRLHDPEAAGQALDDLIRGIRAETPKLKRRARELREMQNLMQAEQDRGTVLTPEPITAPTEDPTPPVEAPTRPNPRNYRSLDHAHEDWLADFDLQEEDTP